MAALARLRARRPAGSGGGHRRAWIWTAITSAFVLVLGVGGYIVWERVRPYLHGSGCEVRTTLGKMPLDLEQGANAATIAAVAFRKRLPERAAVIAYATAIQESHIRNLESGDRDSVGMFQQRPSQGWGSPDKLRDPVQSTSKFFDALVKVKDYLDRDVHDAAQLVQRSADGNAYAQHEPDGKLLARAFTGREPATARCWYPPDKKTSPRRPEAVREMRRAFGGRLQVGSGAQKFVSGPAAPEAAVQAPAEASAPATEETVKATSPRTGWAVAAWAVTHAQVYGLSEVRFAGKHWKAGEGHDGWTKDAAAPTDRVIIR